MLILRGITLLVIALLVFAAQDAIVKFLSIRYEVIQLLTWRIIFVVLMLIAIGLSSHGLKIMVTSNWPLMCLRGVMAFLAFSNYYIALKIMPLGQAATIYMTAPLFVTALSVPLLGETVGLRRWIAVTIGFAAVVYMLNPGADVFRLISALPLLSALFYSLIPIITRKIDSRENSLTIAFYTATTYCVLCLLVSGAVHLWPAGNEQNGLWAIIAQPWIALDIRAWLLIVLSSIMFTVGVLCLTMAYRTAPVSTLAPFEYSYLVWAMLAGFIVFSDIPVLRTWVAAAVIAGSGIYIAFRERQAVAPIHSAP